MEQMTSRFEIKKAVDGRYVFNLRAANDLVILTSQPYESKESAMDGIESVRRNVESSENFEEKTGKDGHPYFVLVAANNQVIGRSQMYSSRAAMRKGIACVRKNSPVADIIDYSSRIQSRERALGTA